MLNPTAPLANGPMVALTPPGSAQAGADDGQTFAQALDQAAARQGDTAGDGAQAGGHEGGRPKAEAAGHPRTEATDLRSSRTSRSTVTLEAMVAGSVIETAADAASVLPVDKQLLQESADDRDMPAPCGDAEPPPADLAAWVSGLPLPLPLPLPRPAPAAGATPDAARAAPVRRAVNTAPAFEERSVATTARLPDAQADAAEGTNPAASMPSFSTMLPSAAPRHADARNGRSASTAALDAPAQGKDASARTETMLQALGLPRESLAAPHTSAEPPAALPALAASPAAASGAAFRPADNAATLQAEVKAPLGSNEFAPALGSHLSVMVRDGIDHAQLKLNPASMGPIEVHISLDGTQAQVDFSAAHAATRQALQDAVPALAGALRENGLTLTGGGVFEQAREQRGEARQDGARAPAGGGRTALDGATAPLPAARTPRARGVVDLYA